MASIGCCAKEFIIIIIIIIITTIHNLNINHFSMSEGTRAFLIKFYFAEKNGKSSKCSFIFLITKDFMMISNN